MYNEEFKKYQMLSEQYYGKNKLLEEIDKAFDRIIANIGDYCLFNQYKLIDRFSNEIKLIENNIQKLFNFKKVGIFFIDSGTVNSHTFCEYGEDKLRFSESINQRELNKNGIRFKSPDRTAIINIGYQTLFLKGITGSMLTAVLLHEIGHNFFILSATDILVQNSGVAYVYTQLLKNKSNISLINIISDIMSNILITKLGEPIKNIIASDEIKNNTLITQLISIYSSISKSISTISFLITPLKKTRRFLRPHEKLIDSIMDLFNPKNKSRYRNEQFATNFATSYGYGAEIISYNQLVGSNSLNLNIDRLGDKTKIINLYMDIIFNSDKLLLDPFDISPSQYSESLDQIDYLKSLLNNEDYDDRTKKQILNDLNESQKNIKNINDNCLSLGKQGMITHGNIITAINTKIYSITGGDIGYKIRGKGYDNKGNWKYMI